MSNLNTRANNTKSLHLINCKEKSIQLDSDTDVATDQDLHCLSLILSHITQNGLKRD